MARILLVDDDEAIRSAGAEVLRALGHEVVTAEDGLEGAQRLSMQSFELVITDMRMPGLDGMALIAAAHRFQPSIRIIASGGDGSLPPADPTTIARRLGVQAALPKPYQVGELCSAIALALANPSVG